MTGPTASVCDPVASDGTTIVTATLIENHRVTPGRGMVIANMKATGTNGDAKGLRILGSIVATSAGATGGPVVAGDSSVVQIQSSSAALELDALSRNLAVPRIVYTPTTDAGGFHPINIYGTIFDCRSGLAANFGALGSVPNGDCN